jgi:hypothetical protein
MVCTGALDYKSYSVYTIQFDSQCLIYKRFQLLEASLPTDIAAILIAGVELSVEPHYMS